MDCLERVCAFEGQLFGNLIEYNRSNPWKREREGEWWKRREKKQLREGLLVDSDILLKSFKYLFILPKFLMHNIHGLYMLMTLIPVLSISIQISTLHLSVCVYICTYILQIYTSSSAEENIREKTNIFIN